jgi:hypothetical protein
MKARGFGRWIPAVVLSLLFLCVGGARAQETAGIVGTVTDSSGAVVPGASVTLTNIGTNISQTANTSDGGDYVFTLLQVGNYTVKVEAKGFKSFSASGIVLAAGDRARVDAKMQVGDVAQTVEVSGSVAPALQTDTSTIGSLVPSQSVEDLPLDGRNIVKLVQLSAGTTEGSPGSIALGGRPDDRRQTSAYSVNGQSDYQNNNLIDGMDNNERIIGTIGVRPSIDAIQEVNVQTNKYDASVGRTSGGVVDVITKSGTNDFHGSAFEFFRNKVLNTNPNWAFTGSSAPNPAFRQNQWGASLGGPVIKNRTFFFADYEGYSNASGLAATNYTVPTYCERGLVVCPDGKTQLGDFSDIKTISVAGGGSALGGPGPDITPTSTLGLAFFNMYPLPTCGPGTSATCSSGAAGTSNNYTSAPIKTQKTDTYDGRIDEHFSDRDSLYGRYTHNGETTISPNGFPNVYINANGTLGTAGGGTLVDPVVTSYAGPNTETQEAFALSYVHVFNPNLLLNLKAGVFRSNIQSNPANQGTNVSTKLGFPCNSVSCINFATGASGLVHMTPSSVNGSTVTTAIGDTTFIPLYEFDTVFQYLGGLTWNKGPHSVRFGLGLVRRRATIGQSNSPQGAFSFSGAYTGVALGDLLEGLPITQSRTNSLDQPGFRMWEPSGYVQDDWRARPWLTLNIGVRYDIFTPFTEVHGRMSNYDPYLGLLVSPSLPGAQQSGATALMQTPYKDFSPRFGFAATLHGNFVLRGGFGMSYYPGNNGSDFYFKNAPFNFSESCTVQNEVGTNNSCASAAIGNAPAGYFSNSAATQFGAAVCLASAGAPASGPCPAGTKANSASNVAAAGGPGGAGGAMLSAGLPVPIFNINLATNPSTYAGTTIQAVIPNQKEAYVNQFNLQIQKQFGANVVTLGYVGEIGIHQPEENGTEVNQNQPANPTEVATPPMTLGGDTFYFGHLNPYPYLATTTLDDVGNIGTSAYQGLQTSFVRRFSKGLTVNFNYTWSHFMDNVEGGTSCVSSIFTAPTPCFVDSSNGISAVNPTHVFGWQKYAWGNGVQDVADRFSWAADYQIPFGKSLSGVSGEVLKGWGVNVSGSFQTGLPFTVTAATSNSNTPGTQLLDQIGPGHLSGGTRLQWFNYNAFVHPAAGTLGDEHPGQLFGPAQKRLDFSLSKDFPIHEQIRMQFRAEVFNLFNSTNMGQPAASIAFDSTGLVVNPSGTATRPGQITSMSANWNQREVQLALKLLF